MRLPAQSMQGLAARRAERAGVAWLWVALLQVIGLCDAARLPRVEARGQRAAERHLPERPLHKLEGGGGGGA